MPETNAVIVRGRAQFKSGTAIEVLRWLPRWRWARLLSFVPGTLRDFIYDRIAQNRCRLFGRTEACMMPTSSITRRFVLDSDTERATLMLGPERQSPFQDLLGSDFARLPELVRRIHGLTHSLRSTGRADVCRAPRLLARGCSAPLPDCRHRTPRHLGHGPSSIPTATCANSGSGGSGRRRYSSTLRAGDPARARSCWWEHFGPFDLEFYGYRWQVESLSTRLHWSATGWRFLGVRLPRQTVPRIHCVESGDSERFMFDIDVAFPLIGQVIRYCGALAEMSVGATHNTQDPACVKSA